MAADLKPQTFAPIPYYAGTENVRLHGPGRQPCTKREAPWGVRHGGWSLFLSYSGQVGSCTGASEVFFRRYFAVSIGVLFFASLAEVGGFSRVTRDVGPDFFCIGDETIIRQLCI